MHLLKVHVKLLTKANIKAVGTRENLRPILKNFSRSIPVFFGRAECNVSDCITFLVTRMHLVLDYLRLCLRLSLKDSIRNKCLKRMFLFWFLTRSNMLLNSICYYSIFLQHLLSVALGWQFTYYNSLKFLLLAYHLPWSVNSRAETMSD